MGRIQQISLQPVDIVSASWTNFPHPISVPRSAAFAHGASKLVLADRARPPDNLDATRRSPHDGRSLVRRRRDAVGRARAGYARECARMQLPAARIEHR
ncbi:hypothetical protein [Burkholderia vietnamiensis]|uniref:hypothetical protein n=1 Tax=Burkholderia vietnamiensis TaxID=60552 RepID=UPI0012D92541|nr:hypothetical protein [Burkholderia vietnamiensis]